MTVKINHKYIKGNKSKKDVMFIVPYVEQFEA